MKKILILICLFIQVNVYALNLPEIYSSKVLIYDLTDDTVLLEQNSQEISNIASLTKIMTTITAIEKNPDIKKEFLITDQVFVGIPWDASVAGLTVGDNLTIEDLLYASILPSGADATQALAISSSSTVSTFVKDMNDLASKIGATNTHFKNVTGLDEEGHYSTAEDILKILKYSLKNETFKKIFCTKDYTLSNGKIVKSTVLGYTKNLNLDTSKIIGSKTGYTSKSGLCIAALTNINGHDVIIITLKAPPIIKEAYNVKDALTLIKFLESNYDMQALITSGSKIKSLPVELSQIDEYEITSTKTVSKYLPTDYNQDLFKVEYIGEKTLSFNSKGKIGNLKYYYDGVLLDEEEVIIDKEIKIDIFKVIIKYKVILILMLIGIIILLYLLRKLKKKKTKRKRI